MFNNEVYADYQTTEKFYQEMDIEVPDDMNLSSQHLGRMNCKIPNSRPS